MCRRARTRRRTRRVDAAWLIICSLAWARNPVDARTDTVATMTDSWDPAQYHRFRRERRQPWEDLVALVEVRPDMRVVDLGCGSGELTIELAQRLGAKSVLGI